MAGIANRRLVYVKYFEVSCCCSVTRMTEITFLRYIHFQFVATIQNEKQLISLMK